MPDPPGQHRVSITSFSWPHAMPPKCRRSTLHSVGQSLMTTSADDNQGRIGTTLLGFRPRPKSDAINVAPECSRASAIAAPLSESCSRALPSTGLLTSCSHLRTVRPRRLDRPWALSPAEASLGRFLSLSRDNLQQPLSGPLKSLQN